MRRILAGFAGVVILLTILTGCRLDDGSTSYGAYDRLCVNPVGHIYVSPYSCQLHPSWWYYAPAGTYLPGYGHTISHYSTSYYHKPSNAQIYTGKLPAKGTAPKVTSGKNVTVVKPANKPAGGGGVNIQKNKPAYRPPARPAGKR